MMLTLKIFQEYGGACYPESVSCVLWERKEKDLWPLWIWARSEGGLGGLSAVGNDAER